MIDTDDRFDPVSAHHAGVDLARLLWVRETGNADRALKATNLVLQAGGFGLVAFDVADVRGPALRRFPHTTWMRISRVIEGSATVAVLIATEHLARSPGGVTIGLGPADTTSANGEWAGDSARARRLKGLTIRPRVISARMAYDNANSQLPIPPPARQSVTARLGETSPDLVATSSRQAEAGDLQGERFDATG